MTEPNETSTTANVGGNHIELQDVNVNKTSANSSINATIESSLDIEQPVPTVAELRGKSDAEEVSDLPRRGKGYYGMLALPFLVVAVIVIVVLATVPKNSSNNNVENASRPESNFNDVVKYLGDHDVSDYPELIREGSFQNKAARWMAQEDSENRSVPEVSPASKEGYNFIQRYIMALLYYQMGGETWKYDVNFLTGVGTCEWFSWVVMPSSSYPMGVRCNNNELISALILVGSEVEGSFPTELAKLTTLRIIEMDANSITGSIPNAFHTLVNLENLHLSHNKLSGSIPSFLGVFPDLETIDVSFNLLSGTLPTEIATMDNLRGIAVDNNVLHGNLGFWGQWSKAEVNYQQKKLEYIFLEKNMFTGAVEDTMVKKFPSLKAFDISDNSFTGPIPPDIFRISTLQVIDLHENSFSGPLGEIPVNAALMFLALHKNALTGTVHETIGNLQALTHLDLSNNKFDHYDGNGIVALKDLSYLYLSENGFEPEPFPAFIRNMTKLEELSMKSLRLSGTIPTWIGELTGLILLDLDNNDLRGSIPQEVQKLSNLQFLLLNRNELTDDIPVEISDIKSLRLLYLDNNALQGNLNMICDRPNSARAPIMVADCGGADPEVDCDCCAKCCISGEVCNDDQIVPSSDPLWQFGYDRLFYSFGNFTGFFFNIPGE